MKVIKTPVGIIQVDETIKIVTRSEYDSILDKGDRMYLITDDTKTKIITIAKLGAELNGFTANNVVFTPSGNLTKNSVQEAILENNAHIKSIKDMLNKHINTTNPHKVTKKLLEIENVDNVLDINKPVSKPQQIAINNVKSILEKSISLINNKIGNTDISKSGSTVTGAIASLNTKIDTKANQANLNQLSSIVNNNSLISVVSEDLTSLKSLDEFSSKKSYVGTANVINNSWYNIISARHRNGQLDGSKYGMQIYSTLTTNGSLIYRQQIDNKWQTKRIIIDSNNYTNFTNSLSDFNILKSSYNSTSKALSTHTADKVSHVTTAERNLWNSKANGNVVNTINESYVMTGKDTMVNSLGDMQNIRSYVGSAYSKSSKVWFNIINVRHRNGSGDGYNKYGMQIYAPLTTRGNLMYRQIINGIITDNTILDSNNYKAFTTPANIGAALSNHSHPEYFSNKVARAANTVLAAPNGTAGTAVFRKLTVSDLPNIPSNKIQGLGNVANKTIRTLKDKGPTGWKDFTTDQKYVPDMAFMAYWNGAYSNTYSNLTYCNKGAFGTAATKNIEDFAAASHTHNYLPLSGGKITGNITISNKGLLGYSSNDCAGLTKDNNIVFKSWYGVSFSTTCPNTPCTSTPGVSINCRNGDIYTKGVVYEAGTALSNKYQAKGNYAAASHTTDKVSHITAAERQKWNNNSLDNGKVTFTSGDDTNATTWTNVAKLSSGETHSGILNKISTMIKNIRFLYKLIGTTDISKMGDGTITGNISKFVNCINRGQGDTRIFIGTTVVTVDKTNDFLIMPAARVNRILGANAVNYVVNMFVHNGDANAQWVPGLWVYQKSGDFRGKASATLNSGAYRVNWVLMASTKNASDFG